MGELGFNKIFGAILATFLFIFVLNEVATRMFGGAHHGEHHYDTTKEWAEARFPGFADLVQGEVGGGESEEPVFDLGLALANADASAGEAVLNAQCKTCHSWNEGGANGTGPNLYGVINRPIASSATGFSYSGALSGKGGEWTYEDMNAWLTNPGGYARGTSMAYAGLRSPRRDDDRVNVIAYLASLTADAPAFPAPLTTEADAETVIEDVVTGASDLVDGAVTEATDAVQGVANEASETGETLLEQATDVAETATENIQETGNNLLESAKEAVETAEEKVEDTTDGEH